MTVRVLTSLIAATAVVVSLASGCAGDGGAEPTTAMVPSSFTGVTAEIDRVSGLDTEWIIAGSSRLISQLADGADADLLITADAETMQRAIDDDLVDTSLGIIARNRLVLAVAPDNPAGIDRVDDLADSSLLLGVCAGEVPCGRLADEAATALDLAIAADTEEPNVRSLALKIARGELDGGLVYATDARAFALVTVDDERLAPFDTEYVAATVHGTTAGTIEFLHSPEGQAILLDQGFTLP